MGVAVDFTEAEVSTLAAGFMGAEVVSTMAVAITTWVIARAGMADTPGAATVIGTLVVTRVTAIGTAIGGIIGTITGPAIIITVTTTTTTTTATTTRPGTGIGAGGIRLGTITPIHSVMMTTPLIIIERAKIAVTITRRKNPRRLTLVRNEACQKRLRIGQRGRGHEVS